jgi:hypothetical protein
MRQQHKAKAAEPRQCETCSTTLERRRNDAGRLEGFRDFMRRRFCSLSCANSRSKGGESRNAYLFHARKLLRPACEACGAAQNLQAHHVNTDWRNNSPENVQTLCLFCHHFWHAMHDRLGMTPTQRMPKLVFPLPTEQEAASYACAPSETLSTLKRRALSLSA